VIRAGGTLVTIAGPTEARPSGGLTIDFVVVPDRAQLSEVVQRVRDGRVRTNIGNVAALDEAVAAFNPTERRNGKTIIRVRPEDSGRASGLGDHRRLLDRGDRLRPATVARH
jgi:NADPH:quinone reductase-like Zn-dependent oxidoreductase